MREIKFRQINQDLKTGRKQWVYFGLMSEPHCIGGVYLRETLGQFTGLKDNKDKEIFEGDIVERGVILFGNGKFQGYYFDSEGIAETWEDDLCQERVINVIGNIHENPELIA